jgi:hypothetical protein
MSRHNIKVPIYGLTSQVLSQRAWRCTATCAHPDAQGGDRDRPWPGRAAAGGARRAAPGDTYAITCGEPMGYPGGTNMLKVCRSPAAGSGPAAPARGSTIAATCGDMPRGTSLHAGVGAP